MNMVPFIFHALCTFSLVVGCLPAVNSIHSCFIVFAVIFVYLFELCFVTLLLCNTAYLLCIFVVFIMNEYNYFMFIFVS
jgi:hypothetical protein